MPYACLLASLVFAAFAGLQLNDFEQYGTRYWHAWFLVYGATSLASAISAIRPLPKFIYLSGGTLALVGALVRVTAIEWDQGVLDNSANPAGNEAAGLLIVAFWLVGLGLQLYRPTASEVTSRDLIAKQDES